MLRRALFPADRPLPDLPFVGHALSLRTDPLGTLLRLYEEQGGIAPLHIGSFQGFLVTEPELVGEIFIGKKKHYTRKTRVYDALEEFLGKGILTTEGEDWRVHRRIVQPAFHKRRLKSFASDIVAIAAEELPRWSGEIDVADAMMRLTLRIVSEVLLGTRTEDEAEAIGAAVAGGQRHAEASLSGVVSIPRHWPTPRNRTLRETNETLDRVAYRIIDERAKSGERGDDALSMLLDARYEDGSPLPRERIRNELITLLAAGHETTSNALSWTLMRLSRHPDVARRLADEVSEVLGDRDPTFEDVADLTYTRWVFDESMRIHPPVWATGRTVIEEHELGGRTMKPGEGVMISPYVTHRRADLWDNPEGFDPGRWEALSKRGALKPFTYYPFGGGTRKCVGEAFAYLEAILLLAMLTRRMRLDLVPGAPIVASPQITLGFARPLRMRVVPLR